MTRVVLLPVAVAYENNEESAYMVSALMNYRGCFLVAVLGAAALTARAAKPVSIAVASDAADSAARVQAALAGGKVYVADLGIAADNGTLLGGAATVPAGRYRLHVPLALHPLGDPATAGLTVTIRAGNTERTLTSLDFPVADELLDQTVEFVAPAGEVPVTVTWRFAEGAGATARAKAAATTAAPADLGLDEAGTAKPKPAGGLDELDERDGLHPFAAARTVPAAVLLRPPHLEPLGPVALAGVTTDKITYRRGDRGVVTATLRNDTAAPATIALEARLETGLDGTVPLGRGELTVAAGTATNWTVRFETTALAWGNAVAVTATAAGQPPETLRAVFAVPHRFWDVALMATCPGQMTANYTSMEAARAAAAQLKAEGYTGFEAYFWAPCDFLEYTPDTERFYSGQTAYTQSITGTRNLIAACHELGIAATFYANLWGGSGTPAFEIMRRHPDWFGNANFHSGALDDEPLMLAGVFRGPGHQVWNYNQLNSTAGLELFDVHIAEILGTRKMFGWDGIRYDSYYSRPWTIKAMNHVRQRVGEAAPDFLFGYNAFADAEYRMGALDSLRGGMLMAEGYRIGPGTKVADYVRGLDAWREYCWPYDVALGPLYGFTAEGPRRAAPSVLDQVLMSSAMIAAGGHPYYNQLDRAGGDHPGFALRYAEYVYDTNLRAPLEPDKLVTFPAGVDPVAWRELVRCRPLGGNRHRVVVHLLNAPAAYPLGGGAVDQPAPLRNLPVTFHLPAAAKATGAWLLQAVPQAGHESLPVTAQGNAVTVTLPAVRFYGVVVLEFTGAEPVPERTDARTAWNYRREPWQDWWVIGPFPSDGNFSGFDTVFPPEQGIDLKATYKTGDDREVAWKFHPKPAAPVGAPLSVDFLAQWPGWATSGMGYAWTRVVSDRDQEAWLYTGSDDTLTLWLNGEKVLALRVMRPTVPDSEVTKVRLKKGVNNLLAKVGQGWGDWSFYLRLGDATGKPLPGVTVDPGLAAGAKE